MASQHGEEPRVIELKADDNVRILSGKMPGQQARARFHLDELDSEPNEVIVRVYVPVLTSSFILGMFSQSVRRLGVEKFQRKYKFEATPSVLDNIQANVRISASNRTALSPS